tara:strand:+ start:1368 stop:1877 length:510 start_codon:yes stop_codon:yes gene_type:complete
MISSEKRIAANRINCRKSGNINCTPRKDKRTYDLEPVIDAFVGRAISGKRLPTTNTSLKPISEDDQAMIKRIVGCSAEEFQARFSERLRVVANKAVERIEEKLDEGGQKLSDLNMTVAITVDKLAAMNSKPTSANLSVQINNYGSMSRDELLASLRGEKNVTPPDMDVI